MVYLSGYKQNPDGYIVYEDGGTCPIAFGASEKWFPTYDEAIEYALGIVKRRMEELKSAIDCNSVVVYEGSESLMRESHSVPCGRVVFNWSNWKRQNLYGMKEYL